MPIALRSLLFALTCAAYAVGTFVFALRDPGERGSGRAPAFAPPVLLAGCLAHAALLADPAALAQNPSARAISAIGLVLAALFFVVRRQSPKSDWLASVVLPAATILVVIGEAIPVPVRAPTGHSEHPLQLALHVASNIVGEALLLFAGASAGAYLVADRQLKRKLKAKARPGAAAALPSLGALDRAGHHLTVAGFVLLTLGLALAPAGGLSLHGPVATRVRALFGVLSWGLLAAVLAARTLGGWHGRRSAIGILTGVAVTSFVVAAYALRSLGAGGAP
jgi:ABC-type uncharacterized transport system permease subunit